MVVNRNKFKVQTSQLQTSSVRVYMKHTYRNLTWCVQVLRSPKKKRLLRPCNRGVSVVKNVYVYRVITLGNDCVFSFLWWVVFLNKLGDLRTWTPHATRRSAFFELSHPRTHIFPVHNAITACLTLLSMNFDWFHATQVEESDNHALFFACKRHHFSIKNTTATRPRHKHSTGSTVLPLGLAQPKGQPRLLQQLSRFYLLPFPEKKIRIP